MVRGAHVRRTKPVYGLIFTLYTGPYRLKLGVKHPVYGYFLRPKYQVNGAECALRTIPTCLVDCGLRSEVEKGEEKMQSSVKGKIQ